MVKKTVQYTDLNGEPREEVLYFHLSKADLIAMEARRSGGLRWYLERISQERDTEKIWGFISEIVLAAYGKKSDDGSRHIKNPVMREEFASSEAFGELMIDLLKDPAGAAEFINGLPPHDLRQQVAQMGPRPAVTSNVFEEGDRDRIKPETAAPSGDEPYVHTESRMVPAPGALAESDPARPAFHHTDARVLTEVEIREMDAVELQRGLVEGRYKLS